MYILKYVYLYEKILSNTYMFLHNEKFTIVKIMSPHGIYTQSLESVIDEMTKGN